MISFFSLRWLFRIASTSTIKFIFGFPEFSLLFYIYDNNVNWFIIRIKIMNSKFHPRQSHLQPRANVSNARQIRSGQPYFLELAAMATKMKGRVSIHVNRDREASLRIERFHQRPKVGITEPHSGRISTPWKLPIAIGGFTRSHDCSCIRRQIANAEIMSLSLFLQSAYWHLHLHSHVCNIWEKRRTLFYKSDVSFSLSLSPSVFFFRFSFESSNQSSRDVACASDRDWLLYTVSVFARLLSVVRLLLLGLLCYSKKIAPRTCAALIWTVVIATYRSCSMTE